VISCRVSARSRLRAAERHTVGRGTISAFYFPMPFIPCARMIRRSVRIAEHATLIGFKVDCGLSPTMARTKTRDTMGLFGTSEHNYPYLSHPYRPTLSLWRTHIGGSTGRRVCVHINRDMALARGFCTTAFPTYVCGAAKRQALGRFISVMPVLESTRHRPN
jgi:hypothetical protein